MQIRRGSRGACLPGARRKGRAQLFAAVGLLIGGCQANDGSLFFTGIPYPQEPTQSREVARLELVREYGSAEGDLAFGTIAGLAISQKGILAVVEPVDCRVWLVDTGSGEGRTVGRCGDGPGEFRRPAAAAFAGDTLVVFDADRLVLVKIAPDGVEAARFPLALPELGAIGVSDLHVGQDRSILSALVLLPSGQSSEHLQIAAFDWSTGAPIGRGLTAPLIARTTPRPILRPGTLCVSSSSGAGDMVVAVNTWGPQVAILDRNGLKPLVSVRIPVAWAHPSEHSQRRGHWGPMNPQPRAACGERYAVIGYRRQETVPRDIPKVLSAAMVVLDLHEQSLSLLGGDAPPETGSVLLMTPGAAAGDRFFFFSNGFFGYPMIREYRLRLHEGSL